MNSITRQLREEARLYKKNYGNFLFSKQKEDEGRQDYTRRLDVKLGHKQIRVGYMYGQV